jgi:hypothetical protein
VVVETFQFQVGHIIVRVFLLTDIIVY